MNRNKKTFLNYFLLILWMGFIYFLSAQPDLKSGFESQMDLILRKIAHITEYGILAFLAWRAASGEGEKKNIKYLAAAIIFSLLYAVSDEYHQLFVHGRVGSPIDVAIDSAGVLISAVSIKPKFIKRA